MTGNLLSGVIRNRFGPRVPVVAGQLSMVVGLTALLITAPLGSPVLTAFLLVFIGPGGAVAMPSATGLILDSVPADRAGTASATCQQPHPSSVHAHALTTQKEIDYEQARPRHQRPRGLGHRPRLH
jgi:hypothetical protein